MVLGFLYKVFDLVIGLVSFLFEPPEVDGDDDVEVRDGACHLFDFFEDDVVVLCSQENRKQDEEADQIEVLLNLCLVATVWS